MNKKDILGGLYGTAELAAIDQIRELKNQIMGGGPGIPNQEQSKEFVKNNQKKADEQNVVAKQTNNFQTKQNALNFQQKADSHNQKIKSDEEILKYHAKIKALGVAAHGLSSLKKVQSDKRIATEQKENKNNVTSQIERSGLVKGTEMEKEINNPQIFQSKEGGVVKAPKVNNTPEEFPNPFDGQKQKFTNTKDIDALNKKSEENYDTFKAEQEVWDGRLDEDFNDPNGDFYSADPNIDTLNTVPSQDRYWSNLDTDMVSIQEGRKDQTKKFKHLKGWVGPDGKSQLKLGTPNEPLDITDKQRLESLEKETPGSFKFFIEKLHGRSISKGWNVKNPILTDLKGSGPGGKYVASDLPNRMVFPAYIINYFDSYAVKKGSYDFLGRAEEVNIYQSTSRKLTLEFYLISDFAADLMINAIQTSDEAKTQVERFIQSLPDYGTGASPDAIPNTTGGRDGFVPSFLSGTTEMLWHRMTFLAQCVYPWYRADGKMKEQPLVRVRIGDFFDVVGMITNISHASDNFELDLNSSARSNKSNVGEIPLALRVTLSMDIIHEDEPSSIYNKFYNAKAFDRGENGFGTGTSTSYDSALDSQYLNDSVKFRPSDINTNTNDDFLDTLINPDEAKSEGNLFADEQNRLNIAFSDEKIPNNVTKQQVSNAIEVNKQSGEVKSAASALKQGKGNLNDLSKRQKLKDFLKVSAQMASSATLNKLMSLGGGSAAPILGQGDLISTSIINAGINAGTSSVKKASSGGNKKESTGPTKPLFPQYGDGG